jgi:hypothetical protein
MLYLTRSVAAAGLAFCAVGTASAAPAPVGGTWCGAGLLRDFTLEIAQQTQQVHARLVRRGKVREITGHVEGRTLRTDPHRNETMELLAQGNELRIIAATGALALAKGQFFTRAPGGSCSS